MTAKEYDILHDIVIDLRKAIQPENGHVVLDIVRQIDRIYEMLKEGRPDENLQSNS